MKLSLLSSSMLPLAVFAAVATGCVSSGKYDEVVAQNELTRAELKRKETLLGQAAKDRHAMEDAMAAQKSEIATRQAEIQERKGEIEKLQAALESQMRLGAGRSAESQARIATLQKRLTELEALQRAAEARAALYRDLTLRLKKQIDDGNLSIVIRDGRMVLQLPNDVLFDTGRTELKPNGREALTAVADVIRTMERRQFQVAGHTDNVPIHNDRFASNWELSAGRALRVVHFLIEKGVSPTVLSAAGYSEIDPVFPNDTADGRKRNRRTEITLQPNIDELVQVPR